MIKADRYADVNDEILAECMCNTIALAIAIDQISQISGLSEGSITAAISEESNKRIDSLTKEQIRKWAINHDQKREQIRDLSNGAANGAVINNPREGSKKGFRKL